MAEGLTVRSAHEDSSQVHCAPVFSDNARIRIFVPTAELQGDSALWSQVRLKGECTPSKKARSRALRCTQRKTAPDSSQRRFES
jgi:hypothetical protein